MRALKHQKGLSSIGWLLLLGVAGFFLLIFFRLGPLYLSHMGLNSTLKSLGQNQSRFGELSDGEIRGALDKFLTINQVSGMTAKDFKIVRKSDKTLINLVYETRVPILLNVDAVVSFKSQLDSSNLDACCDFLIEDEKKPEKP